MFDHNEHEDKLRAINAHENSGPKVICISSGKGGVGKTLSVVHLAVFARKLGYRVLVIDGDFGMSSMNIVLGVNARYNIRHVFDGSASLKDIIYEGPSGVKLVSSGSGLSSMQQLTYIQKQILFEEFETLEKDFDLIFLDSSSGIGKNVSYLNLMAHHSIVVTTPEPHAVTDTYTLIRALKEDIGKKEFKVLVNMTKTHKEGEKIALRLSRVCKEYLGVDVTYIGSVPMDSKISHYILQRRLGCEEAFQTLSAQAWSKITLKFFEKFHAEDDLIAKSVFASLIHSETLKI